MADVVLLAMALQEGGPLALQDEGAIALMQEEVMAVQAEEVFQDDDLCWQHHVAAAKEGLT